MKRTYNTQSNTVSDLKKFLLNKGWELDQESEWEGTVNLKTEGLELEVDDKICRLYKTHRRTKKGLVETGYKELLWTGLIPYNETKMEQLFTVEL